jgi:hypothetical protein
MGSGRARFDTLLQLLDIYYFMVYCDIALLRVKHELRSGNRNPGAMAGCGRAMPAGLLA